MKCSEGPLDDGKTVDGPRHATMKAIVKGINEVNREREREMNKRFDLLFFQGRRGLGKISLQLE